MTPKYQAGLRSTSITEAGKPAQASSSTALDILAGFISALEVRGRITLLQVNNASSSAHDRKRYSSIRVCDSPHQDSITSILDPSEALV